MSKIINKTPHPVMIVGESGKVVKTFPKCNEPIRLTQKVKPIEKVGNVPLTRTTYGDSGGTLPPHKGYLNAIGEIIPHGKDFEDELYAEPWYEVACYYIVSQLVKSAFPKRDDLLVPAEVVRDSQGNIIGCKSLGI